MMVCDVWFTICGFWFLMFNDATLWTFSEILGKFWYLFIGLGFGDLWFCWPLSGFLELICWCCWFWILWCRFWFLWGWVSVGYGAICGGFKVCCETPKKAQDDIPCPLSSCASSGCGVVMGCGRVVTTCALPSVWVTGALAAAFRCFNSSHQSG